jgi:hypothetical protein
MSSFTQKARNLDSTKGVSIQKEPAGSCKFLKMVKTASCRVDGYNNQALIKSTNCRSLSALNQTSQ